MKKLLLFSGLFAALAVMAAPEGYVSKSASGSTSATVYFEPPGTGQPARLVNIDVTSDKAGSLLSWRWGAKQVSLLKAASSITNLTVTTGTIPDATNLLSVTAGGTMAPHTSHSTAQITNQLVTFHNALGTNLAVGDTAFELLTTRGKLLTTTGPGTNLWFTDNGIAPAEDEVVLFKIGADTLTTNIVATYVTNSLRNFVLRAPLQTDVAYGSVVREVLTNYAVLLGAVAADGVNVHVATTNGFDAGDGVAIRRDTGAWLFGTIDTDGVTTTNIALAAAVGELAAGDVVYRCSTQAYTAGYPGEAGDPSITLDVSTGLAAADKLIVVASPYAWTENIRSAATTNSTYTLTCDWGAVENMPPGTSLYLVTNATLTTTFTATAADSAAVFDVATGLAARDQVLLVQATGNLVIRQVAGVSPYYYQTLNLTTTNGVTFAAGDRIFVLDTAQTTPVGAASLRLNADPLRVLPVNVPGVLSLDGTSAVSLNSVTIAY